LGVAEGAAHNQEEGEVVAEDSLPQGVVEVVEQGALLVQEEGEAVVVLEVTNWTRNLI